MLDGKPHVVYDLNMRIKWNNRWFETEDEVMSFAKSIWNQAWGVEVRKVNKANRTYQSGYTIRWYWRKEAGR